MRSSIGKIVALIVTGFGIGWLAGLSVSPVVSIVITSVTGSAVAIIAALSGVKEDAGNRKEGVLSSHIELWPLSLLIVGVIIGSIFGIWVRNHHLLGSDLSNELEKWQAIGVPKEVVIEKLLGTTKNYFPYTQTFTQTLQTEIDHWVSLGIPKEQVVMRLFERHFSEIVNPALKLEGLDTGVAIEANKSTGTYLFAADSTECISLLAKLRMAEAASNNSLLEDALRNATMAQLRILPDIITDFEALKVLVEQVLCANG